MKLWWAPLVAFALPSDFSAEQLHALHRMMDADGDGKMSIDEVMGFAQKVMSETASKASLEVLVDVDTDRDGHLSLEEHLHDLKDHFDGTDETELHELNERVKLEELKFKASDVDGNGLLSLHEMVTLFFPETHSDVLDVEVRSAMSRRDIDSDGKLDVKEFWNARVSTEEEEDFKALDADGDGLIDLAELTSWESGMFHTSTAMKKLFEIADSDHDEHVTAKELSDARENILNTHPAYHLSDWLHHNEL